MDYNQCNPEIKNINQNKTKLNNRQTHYTQYFLFFLDDNLKPIIFNLVSFLVLNLFAAMIDDKEGNQKCE